MSQINSCVSIFEIPATDRTRAIGFYEPAPGIKIEKADFPGLQMGVMPHEGQAVVGVIVAGEGYEPAAAGVTVYWNGGDDLQPVLDRIARNGGAILVPKTPHADESGYYAVFLDSEGNKLGLASPQ
jgi:uncharacterized protein